jgi:adenylate cyclase
LRARTRRNARLIAVVTVLSAAFGIALAPRTPQGAIVGILAGSAIALAAFALEIALRRRAGLLRRLPVVAVLLLRTCFYAVFFLVIPNTMSALVSGSWGAFAAPWRDRSGTAIVLSFGFAFAINFALILARLLGPRTLVALLTGRYRHPRREQRIVLFMDLRGSTQLAERLGDEKFLRFLNEVFWDITDPVLSAGGEIYRYVGDEIITTWTVPHPGELAHDVAKDLAAGAAAIACVFAIEDVLDARRHDYLVNYGTAPKFRAALHLGPLIVGEMGDVKREIMLLGDTMNTAARIENVCRTTGRDVIASALVLQTVPSLPPGVRAESLGPIGLSGKERIIELFALTRV